MASDTFDRGSSESDAVVARQQVQIVAGSDKEQVSLEIGDEGKGDTAWGLKFTSPIDKEKKQGVLANGDGGLVNALRLEGRFSLFRGEPIDPPDPSEHLRQKQEICRRAADLTQYQNYDANEHCTDSADVDLFRLTNERAEELRLEEEDIENRRAQLDALERRYVCRDWVNLDRERCHLWLRVHAFSATIGSEDFKFFDKTLAAKGETSETVWAVEYAMSFIDVPNGWMYRVGYRREEAFKPADKQTVCPLPNGVDSFVLCDELSIGAPNASGTDNLVFEVRRGQGRLGFSPRVTFNADTDQSRVDVPVYFLRNAEQKWTGGITLGWDDADDDRSVAIFIGAPLDLF